MTICAEAAMPSTDFWRKACLAPPCRPLPCQPLTGLAQLNALHLYGMATAWNELLAEGPRRPMQPEAWLDRLIEAELADRQVRSLRYQLKSRALPHASRPDRHRLGRNTVAAGADPAIGNRRLHDNRT